MHSPRSIEPWWTVPWKVAGIWRNRARTSSRSWKGIWKSRTEAGRQVEIRRVAEQERPHGRTLCSNRRRSCVCSKCTTTCRTQLVRRVPSISRRNSTEAEVDSNRWRSWSSNPPPVLEVHEDDNENEETNENDNKNEEPTDKPEDDDHDMQGEMLPEPGTTTSTPGALSSSRGEMRTIRRFTNSMRTSRRFQEIQRSRACEQKVSENPYDLLSRKQVAKGVSSVAMQS